MSRKVCRLVFVWGVFPCLLWGRVISPETIIRNVEKKLTSAKTLRVYFQETYIWKLTGEEQALTGELLLEGEDRFRVTTEDQIIVSDGETIWTYSKPSHRVLIDKLVVSDDALLPRQILFRYTRDYRVRLEGEENVLESACYVLVFTAGSGDVFIPEVRVWIDKETWVPRQVEQMDLNENRTIYLLREVDLAVPLTAETFRLAIPEGTEVIDMR